MVKEIRESGDIYIVDTEFLGRKNYDACYIIDAEKKAIIETGASTGVENIYQALKELRIDYEDIDYIAPTHLHLDHAGGAGYLAEKCDNAKIICREGWTEYLSDPKTIEKLIESVKKAVGSLAEEYGDIKPIDKKRLTTVQEGSTINLGNKQLEVIEASGHAPHQVCFFERETEVMFVGDEAGISIRGEIIPTTPPPNFNLEKNLENLKKLRDYNPSKLLYTHYGTRENAEKSLKKYGQVLKDWVKDAENIWQDSQSEEEAIERISEKDHIFYDLWEEESVKENIKTDAKGVLLYIKNQK